MDEEIKKNEEPKKNGESKKDASKARPYIIRITAAVLATLMVLELVLLNASAIRFRKDDYADSELETAANYVNENDEYLTADRLERMQAVLRSVGTPKTFDDYNLAASRAIADEKYEDAARDLENAIRLFEGEPEDLAALYVKLGCVYALQSDWETARSRFETATKRDASNADAWLMLAESCLQAEDYAAALDAMAVYGEMAELTGSQYEAIAVMQLQQECCAEAIETCNKALALPDANAATLYSIRSQAWLALGDAEKAALDAESSIAAGNADSDVKLLAAAGRHAAGDYTGALKLYRELLNEGQGSQDLYRQSVECAYLAGDYEAVAELCREVLGLPEDAAEAPETVDEQKIEFFKWLGVSLLESERYAEAETYLTVFLEHTEPTAEGLFLRGLCRLAQEQYESAAQDFTDAMTEESLLDECLYNRAVCYMYLDQAEKATADFQQVIDRNADPDVIALTCKLLDIDLEQLGQEE